jgi:glycosyltransferase involved in cell wall biosynthesis
LKFVPWSKEAEVRELVRFNAGVMPLEDSEWARGKCGFKALQYLSVGIPAVVSDVGVNTEIVDQGINGFLCRTPDDWKSALVRLMDDRQLLLKMAGAARSKVLEKYSVRSNSDNFLRLFELAAHR